MWKALLPLVVGGSLGAVSRWGLVDRGGAPRALHRISREFHNLFHLRMEYPGTLANRGDRSGHRKCRSKRPPRTARGLGRVFARTLRSGRTKKGHRFCGDPGKFLQRGRKALFATAEQIVIVFRHRYEFPAPVFFDFYNRAG